MSRNEPGITLSYAAADGQGRWRVARWVGLVSTWLGVLAAVVGYGLMVFVSVEVVLGLGPILVCLGSVGAVLCGLSRRWVWMVVAGSQVGVSMVFFGCVMIFGWGPGQAKGPFAGMGAVYLGMVGCALVGMAARWLTGRKEKEG